MSIIKNSNLNDKKKRIITNFFIIYKYEWYQYEGNKKTVLNRTKDYYENNKELLREKAGNKHRKLLEEGKNIKREYGWNIILKKYQNSYRQANKSKKSYQFYGFNDICYVFMLCPNMLICPSNIFSSTTVMLLGQVLTFKRSFLLELSTRLLEKSLVVNLLF